MPRLACRLSILDGVQVTLHLKQIENDSVYRDYPKDLSQMFTTLHWARAILDRLSSVCQRFEASSPPEHSSKTLQKHVGLTLKDKRISVESVERSVSELEAICDGESSIKHRQQTTLPDGFQWTDEMATRFARLALQNKLPRHRLGERPPSRT